LECAKKGALVDGRIDCRRVAARGHIDPIALVIMLFIV
jgi:hypothetical protein